MRPGGVASQRRKSAPGAGSRIPPGWALRERQLFNAGRQNRIINPRGGAERLERTGAGVEETGVTHGIPYSLRPSDDLGRPPL
jgi:hypothetical protein